MHTKKELSIKFNLHPQEWDIVDQDNDLIVMHYRTNHSWDPRLDRPSHPEVRGWVYDTAKDIIVAKSFPYTPVVTLDKLTGFDLVDETGVSHRFVNPIVKEGFEGTTIRVFRHGGKTYYASHRRLDTSKSRWGSSIPFLQMYNELGGPRDLFDETKNYSPYCYVFLVVHPDVAHVSQRDIGKGHIQFLHRLTCWEKSPYPEEEVDRSVREFEPVKTLSLDEANEILQQGGFVIVSEPDGTAVKVVSHKYTLLSSIRNNDPNLLHRLNELVEEEEMLDGIKLLNPERKPQKRAKEIIRAYSALRQAVSPHLKPKVDLVYEEYLNLRPMLCEWILELEESSLLDDDNVPSRVAKLVATAHRTSSKQQHYNKTLGRVNSVEEQYKINLMNLLWKENSSSLYALYKGKKQYEFNKQKE
jgi:hypothetical protein